MISGQIRIFDGLRGFMAMWVVAGHTAGAAGFSAPVLSNPALAVNQFMLISGFLLAWNYRRREKTEPWTAWATIQRFYIRRFWRISPLYYLLLVGVGLWNAAVDSQTPEGLDTAIGLDASVVVHMTYLFGLVPRWSADNALPDWSLSLEVQFYLLFPFLMLFIRQFGPLAFASLTLCIFVVARHFIAVAWEPLEAGAHPILIYPQPSVLPIRLTLFAAGMLIAEAFNQRGRTPMALTLGAACILVSYHQSIVTVLISGLLLLALFDEGRLPAPLGVVRTATNQLLSSPLGHWLGRISYGVYLLHALVLAALSQAFGTDDWYTDISPPVRFLVLAGPVFALTFVGAELAHRLIEAPAMRLGRPKPLPVMPASA